MRDIVEFFKNSHVPGDKVPVPRCCLCQADTVFYATASVNNITQQADRISLGSHTHVRGELLTFAHGGQISVGDYCYIGEGTRIWSARSIRIGHRVLISHNVNIYDSDTHPIDDPAARHAQFKAIISSGHPRDLDLQEEPVVIEDDALISSQCIILKGVTIGRAAVVGAGAVVTKDVPPYTLVAGNPARVIRKLRIPEGALERCSGHNSRGTTSPPLIIEEQPCTDTGHFPMTWEQAVEWLREQPDQQDLVRACYFDDPVLDAAIRYHAEAEWQALQSLLPANPGQALDVGAGRGIASYALAVDGWTVTALEPDPGDLVGAGAIREIIRQTGLPITVVGEHGENLPFPDNSFDLVHARQVLHHARDLRRLCAEMARVLKPGGRFIATREHVVDDEAGLQNFLSKHPLHHLYQGENAFPLERYMEAMRVAGLRVKRVITPLESPINTFPQLPDEVLARVRQTLGRNASAPISATDIKRAGCLLREPGRLFSFVAMKPAAAVQADV